MLVWEFAAAGVITLLLILLIDQHGLGGRSIPLPEKEQVDPIGRVDTFT